MTVGRRGLQALLLAALLGAIGAVQYYVAIVAVKDFGWLAAIHHDLIYQVERFLLNMNAQGISLLNSGKADYGSELWLIIPLFKLYGLISGKQNPTHAYYFLAGLHLLCALGAFAVLGWMARLRRFGLFAVTVAISVAALSPQIFYHLAFIKPDPNVVLFCVVAGLLMIERFQRTGRRRYFWGVVGLAAIGGAVKWWGVFLLIPMTLTLRRIASERVERVLNLRIVAGALALCCLSILWIYFMAVRHAQVIFARGDSLIIAGLGEARKACLDNLLTQINGSNGLLLAVLILCVATATAWTGIWGIDRLTRRFEGAAGHMAGFCRTGNIFLQAGVVMLAVLLIVDMPFLASEQLLYSAKHFAASSVFADFMHGLGTDSAGSSSWPASLWLAGLARSRNLAVFLVFGFCVLAYLASIARRGASSDVMLDGLALYTVTMIGFLFVFVNKPSEATQSMLYILMVVFICLWLAGRAAELRGGRRILLIAVCLAAVVGQVIWHNSGEDNLPAFVRGRVGLDSAVASLNDQLRHAVEGTRAEGGRPTLILCQRDFPLQEYPFDVRRLDYKSTRLLDEVLDYATPGDLLLLTEQQNNHYPERYHREDLPARLVAQGRLRLIVVLRTLEPGAQGLADLQGAYLYRVG